jgi:tripartite ATP-independent transporter DctM subunit
MGAEVILGIAVFILLVLLMSSVPVAFALATSGVLGIVLLRGSQITSSTLGTVPYQSTARFTLIVIPMFILMGLLASYGRVAEDTFRVSNRLLRRLPGGLALASIAACAGFGAVSGSSIATAATVGRLSVQEMRRHGYDTAFAAGVVGAAGTLGVLIPPSIILVLYGIITGESIRALLTAGIIPGLLSGVIYAAVVIYRVRRNPKLVRTPAFAATVAASGEDPSDPASGVSDMDASQSKGYGGLVKIAILFTIVMGGLYAGIFTATEAAAMGAAAAFIMLLFDVMRVGPRALLRNLGNSLAETASVTSFIFAILVGASIFTFFLVSAGVPSSFTQWVLGMEIAPLAIVGVLLLIMVPLGMFLDPVSIMLIVLPLAYPVVDELGFSGIWFGILVVKTIEIGLITPPVGINAYIISGAADVSVEDAFKGILWFLPADVATTLLLFFVPAITLWLPSYMAGG